MERGASRTWAFVVLVTLEEGDSHVPILTIFARLMFPRL